MPVAPARAASAPSTVRARPRLIAIAASCTAALALYCTRASLDVFPAPEGPVRVAMLPSWPELAGLNILTALTISWSMLWLTRRRARAIAAASGSVGRLVSIWADRATADVLLPLFALALLILPYLPWIPDAVPVLRIFAGPARFLLWFIVLGQTAFAVRAQFKDQAMWPRGWVVPASSATALVFAASVAAFGTGALRLAGSAIYPGGDEPHYLIITQSLVRDGDLEIGNNHERGDYAEYFGAALEPHYRTRGVDGRIYSIHPIGLPLLAVPAFWIAGYKGVVAMLVLVAAAAATLMWRRAAALTRSLPAATFAWAVVALGAPYFFNAFAVYPEIPAALAVMLAVPWSSRIQRRENPPGVVFIDQGQRAIVMVARGAAAAALPWLSTKYAPMAVTIAGVLAWRTRRRPAALASVLAPFILSVAGWLWFFDWIWGVPLPSVPYGPDPQTRIATLAAGAPGLLIDQEYGVFIFAPALMLALIGWVDMWRAGGAARQLAVESVLIGGALLGTVGAFELWWGGSGIPGRPLVSGLPLLAPAIAWTYHHAQHSVLRRAAHHFLLLTGLAVTGTLLFAQNGLLLAEGRDGASELLRYLSPDWPMTAALPSFIAEPVLVGAARAVPWIVALAIMLLVARHVTVRGAGRAALTVTVSAVVTAVALSVAAYAATRDRIRREPPEARGRIDLLDGFDAVARPYAITFRPVARVDAARVPSLFTMTATPGSRRHPQPIPVLLNARFSLPAGDYDVVLIGNPGEAQSGVLGLQVGRIGRPVTEWPVAADVGRSWQHEFTLHLDASFVGFIASAELAPHVRELRLRPRSIVNKGARVAVPPILAASAYGGTTVYFHDDAIFAEDAGFWIAGRSRIAATVAMPDADRPLVLRIHGGPRPSTVLVETPIWRRDVPLTPGEGTDLVVPPAARGRLIPLRITTGDGFVPADETPGSQDKRFLGCWIEVK